MRFSEKYGYRSARSSIQVESMDEALRNSLWNSIQSIIWDSHEAYRGQSYTSASNLYELIRSCWREFFKIPVDQVPMYTREAIQAVRGFFFEAEWFEVYDFVEFLCSKLGRSRPAFIASCNEVLEREMAGYRLADCTITPITSATELEAIDQALSDTSAFKGAHAHLQRALELLSDRQSPDYRNSIKESISSVESIAQSLTNNSSASLGEALRSISQVAPMHPALNRSLSSLYGYTSDAHGIRHALLDESNLDFVDAKFMLVACAAFVSYLAGKASSPQS